MSSNGATGGFMLMRTSAILAVCAASILFVPAAQAQCPGSTVQNFAATAVTRVGMSSAVFALVGGTGFNCSASPSGAATNCAELGSSYAVFFAAFWPSPAARTMDATGGCVFTCPGGTCKVGSDGLPVELMNFAID
jgi:hypothetical protein